MFSLNSHVELRKVMISSLITCIYLPSIVTLISYKDLLYTVGNGSSYYILVLIFVAELLKCLYLNPIDDVSQKQRKGKNRVGDYFKSALYLLGGMFCFFIGIILFGAPFLDNHEETIMLSSLLTLLTIFPLIAHSGLESAMQLLFGVKHYTRDTAVAMLVNNAFWTVGGAWLGAVVIPLDWNKPWQQWPIPCYLGAVGGYLLSNVLTVFKLSMMSASNKYPVLNIFVECLNRLHFSK